MTNKVGVLEYVGAVGPDLILARCGCGFPAVLVPQRMWTAKEVLGCARCHKDVAEYLAEKAQEKKEQAQYDKEQAAEKAEQYEEYIRPKYEELDDQLKELFRTLHAGSLWFNARSVADLYSINPAEAFEDYIVPLLFANVLLERPVNKDTRPYSYREYYRQQALPTSEYTCRPSAVKQMEQEEQLLQLTKVTHGVASVPDFLAQYCIQDEATAYVSDVLLRNEYCGFADVKGMNPVSLAEWEQELASFPNEKGKRRGIRLKSATQLAAVAS